MSDLMFSSVFRNRRLARLVGFGVELSFCVPSCLSSSALRLPGSACVFLAMAVGLATGMGFLGLAVLFTAIIAVVNVVYVLSPLGRPREAEKTLKIVVPEDLEFDGIFDDVLDRFAAEHELTEVTTSNMGSLYTLEYTLRLREPGMEKRLIDEVRCLNGNLKVTLGKCELKPQGVL